MLKDGDLVAGISALVAEWSRGNAGGLFEDKRKVALDRFTGEQCGIGKTIFTIRCVCSSNEWQMQHGKRSLLTSEANTVSRQRFL